MDDENRTKPIFGTAVDPADFSGALFAGSSGEVFALRAAFLEGVFRSLTRDTGFQEFVRSLLVNFNQMIPCEAASFLEVDRSRNILFFRAALGRASDQLGGIEIPVGAGIAGHVVESRSPFFVSDIENERQHLQAIGKAVGFHTRNMAALPVIIRGRVFGVIELLNRIGEAEFTPEDVDQLKFLVDSVARAIEIRLMIGWAMSAAGRSAPAKVNEHGGRAA